MPAQSQLIDNARLPLIAILGRPNVGKSTLLNRLCAKKLALTHDIAGLTRDIRMQDWMVGDIPTLLCDTAGLDGARDDLSQHIHDKTRILVHKADIILFVIDARAGVLPMDEELAGELRSATGKVLVLANKCESSKGLPGLAEAHGLGLGDVIGISAEHGIGIDEIYDALGKILVPKTEEKPDSDDVAKENDTMRIAVIGRPNAGKSTLVNHMIGNDWQLVGPQAGITRDAAEFSLDWQGRDIAIIDTAGLRKSARINDRLERLSVGSTMQAIQFCTMAVLVIDGHAPLEKQDLTIARQVLEEGRGLILAINKCDEFTDYNRLVREQQRRIANILPQANGIACLPISAMTGLGVKKLRDAIVALDKQWNKRITTGALNRWLQATTEKHSPPAHNGRRPKFRYMAQVKARPPTFTIFSQRADQVPKSYIRYLENSLRENFFDQGPPIRIFLRKPENPYV
ncbi:MAG: ribosome biogenesis GTPase Der [Pseudomonadota bacterium]